jgi:hypothetical protein
MSSRAQPDIVVSNYADPNGVKTTIVLANDRRRNLLGFYIYNFGSLKSAPNKVAVRKYLLATNDAITIGTFFVDSDMDIGYKYLLNSALVDQTEFEKVFFTMAAVARERGQEIRKMIGLK